MFNKEIFNIPEIYNLFTAVYDESFEDYTEDQIKDLIIKAYEAITTER